MTVCALGLQACERKGPEFFGPLSDLPPQLGTGTVCTDVAEAQPVEDLSLALFGVEDSLCVTATDQLFTDDVAHSDTSQGTMPRAFDFTTSMIIGGTGVVSLTDQALTAVNTDYPCGTRAMGITLCPQGASGPLAAGDYFVVFNVLYDAVPLMDATNHFQYGIVFDRDRNMNNNYQPPDPFVNDFFRDTDFWLGAVYAPSGGWGYFATDATDGNLTADDTEARLIIEGATLMAIVPRADFTVNNPYVRVSNFRHSGMFGYDGDWDGDVQWPVDQAFLSLPISF